MPSATRTLTRITGSVAPDPVVTPGNTNATRHLSAGAYLDPDFCRTALGEVYHQPRRVVAPSYGVDPVTVLGHCLRARRALVVRDALLLGTLLLATWVSALALLVTLLALLAVHVLLVTGQALRDSVRYLRAAPEDAMPARAGVRRRPRGFRRLWLENVLAQIVARVVGTALGYLVFLLVGTALATLVWHAGLTGRPRLGLRPSVATAGVVALVFLVPAAARAWSRWQLRALVPDRTPHPPLRTRRLVDIDRQSRANTVVYSGYRPFVGSGVDLRHWSLAQRLVRRAGKDLELTDAEREFETPPFTAEEINTHVREHIAGLAYDPMPERRLSDLTVADRVFVAGTEVSGLLPFTPPLELARIIRNPTAPQRHYLACQVVSWRGELVTTVYVHFAVQGKVLYVELHVTGLLPCDERYRVVDQVHGTSLVRVLRDAAHGLFTAPGAVASAPAGLARAGAGGLTLALTRPAPTARLPKGYDYGARIGLREIGASAVTRDHMQTQDIVKYGRMIERRVLDAVLDFLEDRGVDVTEYRQRSLTILNAGAVATAGGTVHVEGDAVGQQVNTEGGNE